MKNLDFQEMIKKSDFQYERDTVKIFLHFLATKGLCLADETDRELFKIGEHDLIRLQEDFIHECVKR